MGVKEMREWRVRFHPHPRIEYGAGSKGADRRRHSQIVILAKAGIQGMGVSFDKLPSTGFLRQASGRTRLPSTGFLRQASFDRLRTNELSVYVPL